MNFLDNDGYKDLKDASLFSNVTSVVLLLIFHNFKIAPQTKTVCFVGCVSNKLPNNFFVDGCGCQEVELHTSLTNSLTKLWCSDCCNLP